ncbi:MAG: PriCT-2 domain-containing protein, partial [Pseudomonadales bacterium]|nr:PriCT-2 domain-containing protein [Pseudomonadales bacterium]
MLNDISLEVATIALTYIDAHNRDTWLKVGNALKTEFGSSGFDIWDDWSKTADNYDAKAVKSVWRSLTVGKVNIGTVIYLAKQNGFDISKHEVKPIDPQEQAARQAKREQQAREAEAHEKAEVEALTAIAKQIQQVANTPFVTPYTQDKGMSTTGLLSINCNELHAFKHPFDTYNGKPQSIGYALKGLVTLAPFCDLKTGEFVRLQGISGVKATEGKEAGTYIKRFIGKGVSFWWQGYIKKQGIAKIVFEGVSDAQTTHEHTNKPCLAAGGKDQLKKAALALRAECPHDPIIVFGDNDPKGEGQAKAEAAATAVNGIFLLPPSQYKDVNEWVLAEGAESLNKMIDDAIDNTVIERSRNKKAVPDA